MLENLVVSIVLPRNLALTSGAVLNQEVTFQVASELTPFYTSADIIRLNGGVYLRSLSDFTISAMIYRLSREADVLCYNRPAVPDDETLADLNSPATKQYNLWVHARQAYVTSRATFQLIMNVFDAAVSRGSKTLTNFSVSRNSMPRDEGIPRKLSELQDEYEGWSIVLKSGGVVGFNGHVKPGFVAKGLYSTSDSVPGRLWYSSGMGANRKSIPGAGSTGKPFKYASPPLSQYHLGRSFGAYVTMLPPTFSSSVF